MAESPLYWKQLHSIRFCVCGVPHPLDWHTLYMNHRNMIEMYFTFNCNLFAFEFHSSAKSMTSERAVFLLLLFCFICNTINHNFTESTQYLSIRYPHYDTSKLWKLLFIAIELMTHSIQNQKNHLCAPMKIPSLKWVQLKWSPLKNKFNIKIDCHEILWNRSRSVFNLQR